MKKSTRHLTRQLDIIPLEVLGERITIIGAGAVGSFCALSLAKMGFLNITVLDSDTIDEVNLNSQFYPHGAVGKAKVHALAEVIKQFTGETIEVINENYVGGSFPGIVIAALDSMAGRRLIFDEHRGALGTRAIIDSRMGAEYAHLYVVRPCNKGDICMYEKTLYSDADAVSPRCTAKSTMYTVNLITGLVCKAIKDLVTGHEAWTQNVVWNIADNTPLFNVRKVEKEAQ